MSSRRRSVHVLGFSLVAGLLLLHASVLRAQPAPQQITGAVTDATGQPIEGALVVGSPVAGPTRDTRSDAGGRYRLDTPSGGRWLVQVWAEGFRPADRKVVVEGTAVADFRLELGMAESVTVVGRVEVPRSRSAAKTDTDLQALPFSVQALSDTLLHDQRALTIADAMRNVSGVAQQVGFGGLNTRFTIRGFRPPAQLKNGFRQNAFLPLLDLQNAESVEVLKGPASALYGAFEPGGVTNIATKKPLPIASYVVGFTGGSFGQVRPSLDATGPLGARVRYRLNAAFESAGSHRDFVDSRMAFVAPVMEFDVGSRTKLTVEAEYLRRTGGFDRGFGSDVRLLALPPGRNLGEPTDEGRNTTWLASYVLTHAINDRWSVRHGTMASRAGLKTFYFTNGFPLLVGTQYTRRPQRSDDVQRDVSTQVEVLGRLTTGAVRHQLLVGVEAGRDFWRFLIDRAPASRIDIFTPVYGAVPGPFTPFSDGEVENRYTGLYVQDQMELGTRVKALVGGRYSWVDQHEINRLTRTDRARRSGSLSPRAGLVVDLVPELSMYASVSRSTRAETLIVVQGNQLPAPAIGTQFEGGVKASLFGGRLLGTLSGYRLVKENVPVADPADPFAPQLQVGEQVGRGRERDASGEPLRGLRVLVSAAVTRGEVSKDTTIPVGTSLLNIPDRSFTWWTTYQLPTGRLAGLGFGGGLFHTGRRAANATASFFLPSYTLLDATAFYERGRYRLAVNGRNLGNERYFESGGGFVAAYPGQPRAAFLSLLTRF